MRFAYISLFLLPCFCETQRFSPLTQIYAILSYPMLLYFTSRTLLTFCSNIDYLHFGLPTCPHFLGFLYKVQRRRNIDTNALCSLLLLYCKLNAPKRKLRQIHSRKVESACPVVEASWNGMTRAETRLRLSAKRTSPFKSAGGVSSVDYWQPICAHQLLLLVVMLDAPCSEVVWRVLVTHSIRQFPLHLPSRASPCPITFQLESTRLY